ncbi:hypothetical protein [Pararhodonellum marinum]|uniref:hypothetical protein n=1 Tax=Pararhodonellum marinum TaxID=2755358 RepID=UPI00189033E1|nr:hypothetical protein [Pararhodonellum marinum]
MADHPNQVSSSVYSYGANNPVFHTDPDGKCPPWICGAIIGGALDYGLQVTVNVVKDGLSADAFTNVDIGSIVTSAAAGGLSGGLSTLKQIKNASTIVRTGVAALTDATASTANQLVTEGEVSLENVIVDVAIGQIVGKTVSDAVETKAKNSPAGKDLKNAADRTQRVADQPKRSQARQAAKQRQADDAANKLDSYGKGRAAAAGAASSSSTSTLIKESKDEDK